MAKTGRFPITGYESDGSPIVDQEFGYPMDEMAILISSILHGEELLLRN